MADDLKTEKNSSSVLKTYCEMSPKKCNLNVYMGETDNNIIIASKDFDSDTALIKLLMEAAERYYSSKIESFDYFDSYNILIKKYPHKLFLDPQKLALPKQKLGSRPYNNNLKIRWVKAKTLISKHNIYIPFDLISYNTSLLTKETAFIPINTVGCSANTSYSSAILSGLFEVIEKDAVSTVVNSGIELDYCELQNIKINSTKLRKLLADINMLKLKCELVLITLDIPCFVIMSKITDLSNNKKYIGLGTNFSLLSAIISAVTEGIEMYYVKKESWFNFENKNYKYNFTDNFRLDLIKKNIYWNNKKELLKYFKRKKYEPILYKYKTINNDFYVLRITVPELLPFDPNNILKSNRYENIKDRLKEREIALEKLRNN